MSITDELRNWMENAFTYKSVDGDMFHKVNTPWFGWKQDIEEMLDRIDAEHQKALDEWKAEHGQMWLKGYSECHAELMEGNETLASDLERCGWVRLPVDANSVLILDGDKMVSPHGDVFIVAHMLLEDGTWTVHGWNPSRLHHYRSTVENVLMEFADRVCNSGHQWGLDATDTIAEYAAKLRLAGEGE